MERAAMSFSDRCSVSLKLLEALLVLAVTPVRGALEL
jgi:hypothetical protein